MPDIEPLAELNVSPAGKLGLTLYVNGVSPPLAVTGVKLVAATVLVNVVAGTACAVVIAAAPDATARSNDAVAVCPPASVNVTT